MSFFGGFPARTTFAGLCFAYCMTAKRLLPRYTTACQHMKHGESTFVTTNRFPVKEPCCVHAEVSQARFEAEALQAKDLMQYFLYMIPVRKESHLKGLAVITAAPEIPGLSRLSRRPCSKCKPDVGVTAP